MAQSQGIALLCEDALLASLYPDEITDVATYVQYSGRLKSALEKTLVNLLSSGTSIVLDFPANTARQRAWLVGLAHQANSRYELHYIELDDSTCKAQLSKRAADDPERASTDTVEMYEAITRYFEPPSSEEELNLIRVDRQ